MLVGISVEYYTRMERGSLRGVSDSVLESVASRLAAGMTGRTASPARASQRIVCGFRYARAGRQVTAVVVHDAAFPSWLPSRGGLGGLSPSLRSRGCSGR